MRQKRLAEEVARTRLRLQELGLGITPKSAKKPKVAPTVAKETAVLLEEIPAPEVPALSLEPLAAATPTPMAQAAPSAALANPVAPLIDLSLSPTSGTAPDLRGVQVHSLSTPMQPRLLDVSNVTEGSNPSPAPACEGLASPVFMLSPENAQIDLSDAQPATPVADRTVSCEGEIAQMSVFNHGTEEPISAAAYIEVVNDLHNAFSTALELLQETSDRLTAFPDDATAQTGKRALERALTAMGNKIHGVTELNQSGA